MTPVALIAALALVPGPWATWATQAQVPTTDLAVILTVGGPMSGADGLTAIFPQVTADGQVEPGTVAEARIHIAAGLGPDLARGTLYHELGHVFDAADLTLADRTAFMSIWGLSGGWWNTHRDARGVTYSAGEWFAESYRMAATWGVNQAVAPVSTWEGYDFPGDRPEYTAQQRASAELIDAAGLRAGIPTPVQRTYHLSGRVMRATVRTGAPADRATINPIYHHPKESQ